MITVDSEFFPEPEYLSGRLIMRMTPVISLSTSTIKSAKQKADFLQKLAWTQCRGASNSGVKQANIMHQAEARACGCHYRKRVELQLWVC